MMMIWSKGVAKHVKSRSFISNVPADLGIDRTTKGNGGDEIEI